MIPVAVTVVGDTLLDVDWTGRVERVCPDAPVPVLDADGEACRPGGAGLAALCAAAGDDGARARVRVTLVTALGHDAEGDAVRAALERAGVELVDLGLDGGTPTKLRVRADGQSLVRVDRNCSPTAAVGSWTGAATAAVGQADAVLVSDYGRGMAANPVLSVLLQSGTLRGPVVWDPHVRGPRPPAGIDLATPNRAEATVLLGGAATAGPHDDAAALAQALEAAVALTVGDRGAVLAEPGHPPVVVPVEPVRGDVCGAGDRFAAAVAVERARGASRLDAVVAGVDAARRHVLGDTPWPAAPRADAPWSDPQDPSAPAAAHDHDRPLPVPATTNRLTSSLPPPPSDPATGPLASPGAPEASGRAVGSLVSPGSPEASGPSGLSRGGAGQFDRPEASERREGSGGRGRASGRRGGHERGEWRVVAAGGCFDVLHAGHVQLLEAARELGDELVVCLNGDLSVRRLKGPHRPINRVEDRAAVLRGLRCVDDVVVFDEDTPCAALRRIRPAVFVKGGDYAGATLPESEVLAEWGGRLVLLPVVPGRSTSRILHAAAALAAG